MFLLELRSSDVQHLFAPIDKRPAPAFSLVVVFTVPACAGARLQHVAARFAHEPPSQEPDPRESFGDGDGRIVRWCGDVEAGRDVRVLFEGGFRRGDGRVDVEGVG